MLGLGLSTSKATGVEQGPPNDGWLKIDFDGNDQSGSLSGIRKSNVLTGHTKNSSDYYTVEYKMYLENLGPDCWGGTDNVLTYHIYGGKGTNYDHPQDIISEATAGPSIALGSSYTEIGAIYFPIAGDRPTGCAVFYVKDIVWKVFNAGGVLLNTYTSDFTSSTDGWGQYVGNGTFIFTYNATVPG